MKPYTMMASIKRAQLVLNADQMKGFIVLLSCDECPSCGGKLGHDYPPTEIDLICHARTCGDLLRDVKETK